MAVVSGRQDVRVSVPIDVGGVHHPWSTVVLLDDTLGEVAAALVIPPEHVVIRAARPGVPKGPADHVLVPVAI